MIKKLTHLLLIFLICYACKEKDKPLGVFQEIQTSNTKALIQAISIIDDQNIWVSGHQGTYLNTTDGGLSWNAQVMKDADTLQFRDLHAFSNKEVVLMSAGPGKLSQIRKTVDGGSNWEVKYLMKDSLGFLNTIEFWDQKNGLAFGDAIRGELFILKTTNGGDSWERINPKILPKALGSEGGFAASGTCIAVQGKGNAWIATGAGERPRVLHTKDYGNTWSESSTPIVSGEAAGITSINFWDSQHGFIAGGDLAITDEYVYNTGFTVNGGETWSLATHPNFKGSIYGVGLLQANDEKFVFAGGPNGLEYSKDYGTNWTTMDSLNYWAVKFSPLGVGWATGTDGKILKISVK